MVIQDGYHRVVVSQAEIVVACDHNNMHITVLCEVAAKDSKSGVSSARLLLSISPVLGILLPDADSCCAVAAIQGMEEAGGRQPLYAAESW